MKFPIPKLNEHFSSMEYFTGIFSVFGEFGVGKTTFAIQTGLNSLDKNRGILFFYSKPTLPLKIVNNISKKEKNLSQKNILDNFKFIYIKDFRELLDISFNLEFFYLKKPINFQFNKLVVIVDSITDLYKMKLDPSNKKHNVNINHRLNQILANLHYLNKKYNIEILLVNEISRGIDGESTLSGGKVMNYWVSYALLIQRLSILNKRKAFLSYPGGNSSIEFELILTETGFQESR